MRRRALLLVAVVSLLVPAFAASAADYAVWDRPITQLTDNTYGDYSPEIDQGKVTWYGGTGAAQIFYHDGTTTTQLTNTSFDNYLPKISNGQVTWFGTSGPNGAGQIYLWDGTSTKQLTDTGFGNNNQQISNGQVVWQGAGGPQGQMEIYYWNGTTTTQLTNTSFSNYDPQISYGSVVWRGDGGPGGASEIYWRTDRGLTLQVTSTSYGNYNPQLCAGWPIWQGFGGPGGASEIYRCHTYWQSPPGTWHVGYYALTKTAFDNESPQSGDYYSVVWAGKGGPGGASEIYRYDTLSGVTTQLTDSPFGHYGPQSDGANVVWTGRDANGYSQIFFYDGTKVWQVTNTAWDNQNPQVDGSYLTWESKVGGNSNDTEIMLTDYADDPIATDVPEPASLSLAFLALGGWGLARARRQRRRFA